VVRAPVTINTNDAHGRAGGLRTGALALLAIAIHGYHPCAEDGGIYLSGVEKILDPSLYSCGGEFTAVHLRFSMFAPLVAEMVRGTHLGLMPAMLLLYVASTWATLYAVWLIAGHVTASYEGRLGAVLFVALAMTVPVAGTSLILMDPYVTARSISTPCGLFALWCALEIVVAMNELREIPRGKVSLGLGCLLLAAVMHPLMAAYSFGCVLLLLCASIQNARGRMLAMLAVCGAEVAAAGCLTMILPAQSNAYAIVARTRTYWFITEWHWYEIAGLVAPLAVLAACGRYGKGSTTALKSLASMAVAAGSTAIMVALLFARVDSRSYGVALLQPLRIYQTIYVLMLLGLGALAGEVLLKKAWRWSAACVLIGAPMMLVQLDTFPGSRHIELPGLPARNAWVRGFEWIRVNTPKDAVFAMDADYVSTPGEDTQNFRAIAERGALADAAKDGGIAAIAPDLTQRWTLEATAQKNLDASVGPGRMARLRDLSATWIVLLRTTPADLNCPYANERVKVCRLIP
jgi:hypothetical protein